MTAVLLCEKTLLRLHGTILLSQRLEIIATAQKIIPPDRPPTHDVHGSNHIDESLVCVLIIGLLSGQDSFLLSFLSPMRASLL